MSREETSIMDDFGPGHYEIRIKGHLDKRWADWLEGMTFTLEDDGTTNLTGPLTDQAALHGVLNRLRDLALPIISVQRLGPDHERGEENNDRS
jgi:hypothetical protein